LDFYHNNGVCFKSALNWDSSFCPSNSKALGMEKALPSEKQARKERPRSIRKIYESIQDFDFGSHSVWVYICGLKVI